MLTNIPQVAIQQIGVQTVDVGQLSIGPITVGELILHNVNFTMSAAGAVLQGVSVTVTIKITFSWNIHIPMPWPIPDINIGDTYDLGSIVFSLPVGTITIPSLTNVDLNIPNLTATNMSATANPLSVQAKSITVDTTDANKVTLPSAGFSIVGLMMNGAQGTGVKVPAATMDGATIAHVHGNPINIPTVGINNVKLPSAQIPLATTTVPLNVPADLPTDSVGFDAGVLSASLDITPSVVAHINSLELHNANATATVSDVVVNNVTLPYDVLNLTLSQVGINTIEIPSFSIS